MYEELMKTLREYAKDGYLLQTRVGDTLEEAADAIEELSQLVSFYESATDGYWNDIQRITGGNNG